MVVQYYRSQKQPDIRHEYDVLMTIQEKVKIATYEARNNVLLEAFAGGKAVLDESTSRASDEQVDDDDDQIEEVKRPRHIRDDDDGASFFNIKEIEGMELCMCIVYCY